MAMGFVQFQEEHTYLWAVLPPQALNISSSVNLQKKETSCAGEFTAQIHERGISLCILTTWKWSIDICVWLSCNAKWSANCFGNSNVHLILNSWKK